MSLNWNVEKVANYETLCFVTQNGVRRATQLTEAIVFACMACGIGALRNESDARELFVRLHALDAFGDGLYVYEETDREGVVQPEKRLPTYEEVLSHVGLTTNVTTERRGAWRKRQLDHQRTQAAQRLDNAMVRANEVVA